MKTLVLVRHGKASHSHLVGGDIERPLTSRGQLDSEHIAEEFHELDVQVDAILSSPAQRAKNTAKYFAGWAEIPVAVDERIYDAGVPELLDVVQGAEDFQDVLVLVGHNPGISEFLQVLLGCDHEDLPAAAVAVVSFDVSEWVDVIGDHGVLEWFMDPKTLEAGNKAA